MRDYNQPEATVADDGPATRELAELVAVRDLLRYQHHIPKAAAIQRARRMGDREFGKQLAAGQTLRADLERQGKVLTGGGLVVAAEEGEKKIHHGVTADTEGEGEEGEEEGEELSEDLRPRPVEKKRC